MRTTLNVHRIPKLVVAALLLLLVLPFLFVSSLLQGADGVACHECVHESTTASYRERSSARRVTKSLAELATVPGLSDHVLFFNKIPRSGGELIVLLLQRLQGVNFRHIRLGNDRPGRLSKKKQKRLSKNVSDAIKEKAIPLTFDKVVYFTNFTEFGLQSPMYFSMVRDPLENAMSRLSILESSSVQSVKLENASMNTFIKCWLAGQSECQTVNNVPFDFTIPYFCGHDVECSRVNDKFALGKAKDNVDRYYPVVGLLEYLNETLEALENRLPMFFRGANEQYTNHISVHVNNWNSRPKRTKQDNKLLQSIFNTEYEFYNWLKTRLLKKAYPSGGNVQRNSVRRKKQHKSKKKKYKTGKKKSIPRQNNDE